MASQEMVLRRNVGTSAEHGRHCNTARVTSHGLEKERRGHPSLLLYMIPCVPRNRTFLGRLVARVDVRIWPIASVDLLQLFVR